MYAEILTLTILISNINTENTEICKNCVAKCCPADQYIVNAKCEPKTPRVPEFSTIGVYDFNNTWIGNVSDFFTIVTKAVFKEDGAHPTLGSIGMSSHLVLDIEGQYEEIYDIMYCVDFDATIDNTTDDTTNNTTEPQIIFWFVSFNAPPQPDKFWLILKLTALLINCFFLLLVILAMSMVKKLRDLKGKIRLAFVIHLFGFYTVVALTQTYFTYILTAPVTDNACLLLTTVNYYFYCASCCWMNVSTYNLWTSLRSVRAVAANQPKYWDLDRRTFIKFCAYAFLIPCVFLLILMIIYVHQTAAETNDKIISNGICSISDTKPNIFVYYLHTVMLILNLITLTLNACIARDLRVRKRQSKRLKKRNQKDLHKMGLVMHLKIWILTGSVWILDVLTVYLKEKDTTFQHILELFCLCSGIGLFIIIICNKQSLLLIYERFKNFGC